MTTRAHYTTEEWAGVLQAPVNAGAYVITAEPSLIGTLRELAAVAKAVEHPMPPPAAETLVNVVVNLSEMLDAQGKRAFEQVARAIVQAESQVSPSDGVHDRRLHRRMRAQAGVQSVDAFVENVADGQWFDVLRHTDRLFEDVFHELKGLPGDLGFFSCALCLIGGGFFGLLRANQVLSSDVTLYARFTGLPGDSYHAREQ